MENIFGKIEKHGVIGSLKIFFNILGKIPDALRIKIARKRSYNGLIVKEVQGSLMILDLNDVGISRELLLTSVHESESTRQIKKEIKSGMNILEVGANIGYYLLIEAQLIGEHGRIYAFEPSPANMKMLKTNISLNDLTGKVEVFPYGVGSEPGIQKFYMVNKGNMSSFVTRRDDSIIKTLAYIDVEVVRLDDFWKADCPDIDYVRMDVEGYEFEVINGMKGILTSKRPPQGLFIEIHSELLNSLENRSCRKFLDLMSEAGYGIKMARYRGRDDVKVTSTSALIDHELREVGYWEAFFETRG